MDIAIFKSIADLWKNAISIAAQHRKANTEDFEQTFKPLFDQMHTVVAEYYDIVYSIEKELQKHEPNLSSLIEKTNDRRAALIIGRDKLLGEAKSFSRLYNNNQSGHQQEFAEKVVGFTNAIENYFRATIVTGEEYEFAHEFFGKFIPPNFLPFVGLTSPSMITVLVEIVRPNANVREYHRDTLRSYVHEALMTLESRWKVVSEAYTDISLMCKPPLF